MQNLVSNNKMEIQSVIVSKSYPVSTNSTTSTYGRGTGHSIARLAGSENNNLNDNQQTITNHAQFYGNIFIYMNLFHRYMQILLRAFARSHATLSSLLPLSCYSQ